MWIDILLSRKSTTFLLFTPSCPRSIFFLTSGQKIVFPWEPASCIVHRHSNNSNMVIIDHDLLDWSLFTRQRYSIYKWFSTNSCINNSNKIYSFIIIDKTAILLILIMGAIGITIISNIVLIYDKNGTYFCSETVGFFKWGSMWFQTMLSFQILFWLMMMISIDYGCN